MTHWLGLAQDGTAGLRRLSRDPLLGACARRHPHLRLISYPDFFEALVTTVLGQQISTRAARTLALRLVTALGVEHASGFHAFPEAARVAGTSVPDLVSIIRCPASRAATLQRVAQWYLDFGPSMKAPVPQLRQSLLALKGVGPWTVDYVALRGLRARRVFLASDWWCAAPCSCWLGAEGVPAELGKGQRAGDRAALEGRGRTWRPARRRRATDVRTALAHPDKSHAAKTRT